MSFYPGKVTLTISGDASGAATFAAGTNGMIVTLAASGVTAGTYKSLTVDAKGRVTAATNPAALTALQNLATTGLYAITATGTSTTRSIAVAARLTISNADGVAGNPTLDLAASGVTAGTFNSVTTDNFGRVTSGATLNYVQSSDSFTITGDVGGSGTQTDGITLTLNANGVAPAAYFNVTVDATGRVLSGANPTTLAGFGITDAQAISADLSALSSTVTTGLYARTGAGTSATRTITGTANQIVVTNGDGTAANPTLSLAANAIIPGTASLTIPSGTTAQRPSGTTGMVRYNSTADQIETFTTADGWIGQVVNSDKRFSIANTLSVQTVAVTGQFTSIRAAVNSITTNSSSNPFLVDIAPGIYTEDVIILKPYVYLRGKAPLSTTIIVNAATKNAIVAVGNSGIENLAITGAANSGLAGVLVQDASNVTIRNCAFANNAIHVKIFGNASATVATISACSFAIDATTQRVCSISGNTSIASQLIGSDLVTTQVATPTSLTDAFWVSGATSLLACTDFKFNATLASGTACGVRLLNGSKAKLAGGMISGFYDNILADATGTGPILEVSGVCLDSSLNRDLSIENTGTSGAVSVIAQRSNVFADPAAAVSISYLDPSQNATIAAGSLYFAKTHSNLADISDLLISTPPMGMISGGAITDGGGLNVNLASGFGYIETGYLSRVSWSTSVVALVANASNYITVNASGIVVTGSYPDTAANVFLGRVVTTASAIEFIDQSPFIATHAANLLSKFNRTALGPIFSSGSIVTENTTARSLNVTAGRYFLSQNEFDPSGGAGITFITHYHASGVLTTASATLVSNTQYDNGTSLTSLGASMYTKHALYVVGQGANEKYLLVYGNAQYSSLVLVEPAPLPSPPNSFIDAVVPIAAIVVQQGAANIIEILDIRPVVGFKAAGVSATAVHGNLLGLTADDHLQYLLTSGARAMAGNLNLGSNNITSVALINGIDIAAHDSRHLPNNSDALTTAAPSTPLSTTTANTIGIANAFARSDHIHALTNVQPLDSTLTALSGFVSNGLMVQSATDTFVARTLSGQTNQIAITNPDGVSANPNIALATNPVVPGTASITVPVGTTAQRPSSPTTGMLRFNSDTSQYEIYASAGWVAFTSANQVVSYASSISINWDVGDFATLTLSGDTTIDMTGLRSKVVLIIKQDATGSHAVTWGSSIRFGSDITGVPISSLPNLADKIGFLRDFVTGKYDVVSYSRGYPA